MPVSREMCATISAGVRSMFGPEECSSNSNSSPSVASVFLTASSFRFRLRDRLQHDRKRRVLPVEFNLTDPLELRLDGTKLPPAFPRRRRVQTKDAAPRLLARLEG